MSAPMLRFEGSAEKDTNDLENITETAVTLFDVANLSTLHRQGLLSGKLTVSRAKVGIMRSATIGSIWMVLVLGTSASRETGAERRLKRNDLGAMVNNAGNAIAAFGDQILINTQKFGESPFAMGLESIVRS